MTVSQSAPLSLRAFGRRRGTSVESVRRAIKSGRLKISLCIDARGQVKIGDPDLADREWAANTEILKRPGGDVGAVTRVSPAVSCVTRDVLTADNNDQLQTLSDISSLRAELVASQNLVALQRERKLRLENDAREARLIPRALVEKDAFESQRIIREGLLNIARRVAGQIAAETDPVRVEIMLDAAIREALNVTADLLLATANEFGGDGE